MYGICAVVLQKQKERTMRMGRKVVDGKGSKGKSIQEGTLFTVDPQWAEKWKGMPAFESHDQMPWKTLDVHFRSREDQQLFAALVQQKLTDKTKCIWYPEQQRQRKTDAYVSKKKVNPKHPVYVISKGRWESRLTSKALEKIGVPYRIVVEPQERDAYAKVIDPKKILILPFSNLGKGSIPARNWVWEHSLAAGDERHWILDDNIRAFYRLHNNRRVYALTGSIFRAAESFVDRYTNVALAGFQYSMFAPDKEQKEPYTLNTRIYSCILIKNDTGYRWRGRYNEDTDLSIRVLKDRWCTVLFNAFLCDKIATMTMKGGNTDELYKDDGRLKMAQSLQEQHPDCVTITTKWGRAQHHVNYPKFFGRNRLKLRPGVVVSDSENEFAMELEQGALKDGYTI